MASPEPTQDSRLALVLSGGGARGAYQVGVLQALLEQGSLADDGLGFDILIGSSAGAINASQLAAHADDLAAGVARLAELWGGLEPQQVFRTDLRSLGGIGARWIRDLSFGGLMSRTSARSLLDTAPLRGLLETSIPFDRIPGHVADGALHAFAIPATDLYTADGVVFLEGAPEIRLWQRGRWSIERARIASDHVMASSAIPIFFPSVEIEGRHLGDGSLRNTAPLSPAINLGADRIVAIGVRQPVVETGRLPRDRPPSIAQIAATLLDAVMLDAVAVDVEHSERVNTSVIATPTLDNDHPFREIDVLWISPSRHLHHVAKEFSSRIPPIVRYLMSGLGSEDETTELASYLLFDGEYCRRLMEIGRSDGESRAEQIRAFLRPGAAPERSVR